MCKTVFHMIYMNLRVSNRKFQRVRPLEIGFPTRKVEESLTPGALTLLFLL